MKCVHKGGALTRRNWCPSRRGDGFTKDIHLSVQRQREAQSNNVAVYRPEREASPGTNPDF